MISPPKLEKKSPLRIREFINDALIPWIKSGRVVASELCDVDERESGTQIIPRSGRRGGSAGAPPDKIVQVRKIGENWRVGVSASYILCDVITPGSTPPEIVVEDKLTTGADADPGWRTTFENDYVWIEMTVTDFVVTSAYVMNYGSGGDFGGGQVEHDGGSPPAQSKARALLAQIVSDGSGGLIAKPFAGAAHQIGITFADAADSSGGNSATISAAIPWAM